MEKKLSSVAKTLSPSPIQQLSYLAQECDAINLAEGFPDFPAPSSVKEAAISAINSDFNQYRHVQGICEFVARKMKQLQGIDVDPSTDVVICCGQSEAFAAASFAIIDPGDEVILFDPSYETYDTCIRLAGGVPVYVALDPPHWTLSQDRFEKSFSEKTKALVLNSPHNPTGKVFSTDDLRIIAAACKKRDVFAITDEVYEHLTYDDTPHVSLASLPEMQRRTIITSSLSKTFSVTGWRIGWAVAPSRIASAIRNIHIKITDSAPAPFQEAALSALASPPSYFDSLRREYTSKRDAMVNLLIRIGFKTVFIPRGSVFVFAELPPSCPLSDCEFVEKLIKEAGVVAVPGSGFFHCRNGEYCRRYIRFAFCKSHHTLASASEKMMGLVDDETGHFRLLF
ncbi:hypothetical protein M569_12284 [Genlisea aurea]|uniref:Aminotransferase class I/classII large domain-containing protein n=1 Tax=Genlisea aurea TaxID=192259 RepID=S8C6U5_9LAMI|nr:hypothetical protein M569_12284 [Genlisea aurea]